MANKTRARESREDAALQALLTHHSIRAAATAAKISERTLRGYLADPAFSERLKNARADVFSAAVFHLQAEMDASICVLASIRDDTEIRAYDRAIAAVKMLEYSSKFTDTHDLQVRLEKFESERGCNDIDKIVEQLRNRYESNEISNSST